MVVGSPISVPHQARRGINCPKPKKKFIDKKKAITFHLVHRSQRDPLVADETAPQHVLLEVKQQSKQDMRKEEQMKYGIFFDDNYDYLQHLRPVGTSVTAEWEPVGKPYVTNTERAQSSKSDAADIDVSTNKNEKSSALQLPSSVFASHIEDDVGMLNRAAPRSGLRLDLDPDVVAAMDEDFNFDDPENQLEDNFVELANAPGVEDYSDTGSDDAWTDVSESEESSDIYEDDDVGSLTGPQLSFTGEEIKSRFTEYSMTSSVIRRNNQLTLLDSRFEQLFSTYNGTEIGALDCDEIEGHVTADSQFLRQCAQQFEEKGTLKALCQQTSDVVVTDRHSESDNEMVEFSISPRTEQWDCESVLTSRSKLYNHPKLIPAEPSKQRPIRVSRKTGIPVEVLSERRGLTARALASMDIRNGISHSDEDSFSTTLSVLSTLSIRPKGETSAQRHARKQTLKEYRKVYNYLQF